MHSRLSRAIPLSIVAITVASLLAGCASAAPSSSASSERASVSAPPASAPPASATSPASSSSPSVSRVGFTCAQAVPAESGMWQAGSSLMPVTGASAAAAVQFGGIACQTRLTGGVTAVFSVALPPSDRIATLEQAASAGGKATSALGGQQGYFGASGTGAAQVFAGGYWITATSKAFTSADKAAPLITQIINVLPQG